jgi:hypothetical protein
MRKSIFNPRILISAIFTAGLFWSVIWAYIECPRLQVGFGGISETILIHQNDIKNVEVRSTCFRDELEKRLTSAEFMKSLHTTDSRQPRFFLEGTPVVVRRLPGPSLDTNPLVANLTGAVSDAYKGQTLAFLMGESGQSDLYLMYIYPQSYRVEKPDNPWILWLQSRLPGMPDTLKLAAEVEAANLAIKDEIRKQVQQTVEHSTLSSGH